MNETFQPELVKKNYDEMPYPPRDPEDERRRLFHAVGSNLLVVNHHCFGGRKDFRSGFRCLVAGGGTGDDAIYLAEQLKDTDAEIVYIDVSESAKAIAQQRADIRGLGNITWITDSLMNIPSLGLGEFDFIQCGGVLHHIDPIEDGLAALRSAMKSDGAIMLTLYGKYGMRPVYEMQALLAELLPKDMDIERKIAIARRVVADLPDTHRFKRDLDIWKTDISPDGLGDTGVFFLLLHSELPSFDVPELHELANSARLELLGFVQGAEGYDPETVIRDPSVLDIVRKLDAPARQAIAEKYAGTIYRHDIYLGAKAGVEARLDDDDNALVAFGTLLQNAQAIADGMVPGRDLNYNDPVQSFSLPCTPITKVVFARLDGGTSVRKLRRVIKKLVPGVSKTDIAREIRNIYRVLHPKGYLYLIRKGDYGVTVPDYLRMG